MQGRPTHTKPLILVDGSSYLYRAFHALPSLSNSNREPTGAIYGVANMLRRLINDYHPERMAVVFDAKGKTFRDDLYAEYKAQRSPMPDELSIQVGPLKELIEVMGIPLIEVPGVEADDVIGTLVERTRAQGVPVVISTGDKDIAQLVGGGVSLVNTMNDTRLDSEGVTERFGVPPERIVDLLALMGDKSDNIPGVDGVGPKTAAKWLSQFGSLEAVLRHADEIKGKAGERLRAAAEKLPLSYELATIRCDVDVETGLDDLRLREPEPRRLRELLEHFDFHSWLKDLREAGHGSGSADHTGDYELILVRERMDRWVEHLKSADLFAFDTETTSLDYMQAEVVGMSFATTTGEAAYLPFGHDCPGGPGQLSREEVFAAFRPLLEDPDRPKLGHNLKYDRHVLANHGIQLNGITHDTMLESYVLNSTANRHDLDTLCEKYLHHTNIHYEDVAGKGARQVSFDQVPLEQAAPYAAEDADMTLRLHHHFWPKLEPAAAQRNLYSTIEIPLVPVLSHLERNGVKVDPEQLARQSAELAQRMREIERQVHEMAGGAFNLNSPKQLQRLLFEALGLPVVRKTPKGQPSTAEDVLQELAADYPLPRLILGYRSLSKLKSTYTDKLPELINARTGRVHTSYQQAVASTGRLSSTEPNLQNIPIRTEEGRRIRQAFVAAPGSMILAADYSQIELRIMAHLSGDEGLRKAFSEGRDIHRSTAAEVFGVPLDAVSPEQRRAAKAINFGLMYGMSAFGLARQLGIERISAQEYIGLYFARYPGVKAYMDRIREQARQNGYVETLYGRRLYLPEINSRNAQRRQYAERTAINAPMQGSSADIIKRAMIDVDAWVAGEPLGAKMIMQVHDELVFEVPEDRIEGFRSEVVRRMAQAADLIVPLEVEAAYGANWDEAH